MDRNLNEKPRETPMHEIVGRFAELSREVRGYLVESYLDPESLSSCANKPAREYSVNLREMGETKKYELYEKHKKQMDNICGWNSSPWRYDEIMYSKSIKYLVSALEI